MSSLLFALAVLVPGAHAQEDSALAGDRSREADFHFRQGVKAYQADNFESALGSMLRSNRLAPNKNVVFNIGRIYEALGSFDDAYRAYSQFAAVEDDPERLAAVRSAMDDLEERVALVEITSDPPGASVYIDRKDLGARGVTPLLVAVKAGEHPIILQREGYFEETLSAEAVVGSRAVTETELRRLLGKVKITGEAGADVYDTEVQGEPLCTVPCDVEIPIGQRVLRITKDGYRTQTAVVTLAEAGDSFAVEAAPARLTGALRVDANVENALVRVDGTPVGYTPLIASVPSGARQVTVEAEGFASYTFETQVEDGETAEVGTIRLLPRNLVVSASRVAEDVFEAPSSISVVSAAEIEAFGYPTLQEALRGVRGVSSIRNDLDSMAMVRGVGTASNRGTQSKTLLNGVALTDQLTGRQYLYSRAQNIESIEVQRGSGSVLYGSGALTSLISVRTRGRMEGIQGNVSGGFFGREGRFATGGSAGTQDFGARVSVNGQYGEGDPATIPYSRDPTSGELVQVPVGIDRYAPWRGAQVHAMGWAKDLEVWAQYAEDQVEVTSNAEGSVLENLEGDEVENPQRIRQLTLSANYRPKISERTELDFNLHYRQSLFDNDATWQRSTAGVQLELLVDQQAAARWMGGGVQLTTRPIDSLRIVSGVEFYRSVELSLDQSSRIYLPSESRYSTSEAGFDFKDAQLVYAGYAVVDFQPIRFFKASAGVRVDKWHQQRFQANPRLVAMLFPTKDDAFKVMVGRAFRAPVTYEQKYFVESISVPALGLKPESGWSFEGEYSHRLREWTGLVSGWGATYDNVIVSSIDPTAGGLSRYVNAGTNTVFGVDAEVRRDFSNGMMFSAWYSYQVPRSALGDGDPVSTPEQPRHLSALKLVMPIMAPGLNIAGRVVYEGARPFRTDTLPDESAGAVLADLVVSGSDRRGIVGWRAGVYNVLDSNFSAATYNSTTSPTLPQTSGRTFMASLDFAGRVKKKKKNDNSTKAGEQ